LDSWLLCARLVNLSVISPKCAWNRYL